MKSKPELSSGEKQVLDSVNSWIGGGNGHHWDTEQIHGIAGYLKSSFKKYIKLLLLVSL